jgi:hypothetical protein
VCARSVSRKLPIMSEFALNDYLMHRRKVRVVEQSLPNECSDRLRADVRLIREFLHCDDGILLKAADDLTVFPNCAADEPWVGYIGGELNARPPDGGWKELAVSHADATALANCQGLWVRSPSSLSDLRSSVAPCPINVVTEPGERHDTDDLLKTIQNTAIYRSLPTPRSQEDRFTSYDATVLICAYRRIEGIGDILNRFTKQEFCGRFELVLWNNNPAIRQEIDVIADHYRHRLDLKVIHSSENYFCIVRLAMAALMRSDLLLVCDDDVKPSPRYVTTFIDRYRELGPDAVICARGHIILPHVLNEDHPELAWDSHSHMVMCNEDVDDCQIQFMHASSCLIPRHILQQCSAFPMPRYEFAFVDDYWLSYVISDKLKMPIWKIRADEAFEFDPSWDDPKVAHWRSIEFREQKVNFYVYHMRRNWPPGCSSSGLSSSREPLL